MQQSRGWVHYAIHRPRAPHHAVQVGPCHACCSSLYLTMQRMADRAGVWRRRPKNYQQNAGVAVQGAAPVAVL